MNKSDEKSPGFLAAFIERFAHPLFLLGALGIWWSMGRSEVAVVAALGIALFLMEVLERLVPAMPDWRQSRGEKLQEALPEPLTGASALVTEEREIFRMVRQAWDRGSDCGYLQNEKCSQVRGQ